MFIADIELTELAVTMCKVYCMKIGKHWNMLIYRLETFAKKIPYATRKAY
jgi:hypothetical protein